MGGNLALSTNSISLLNHSTNLYSTTGNPTISSPISSSFYNFTVLKYTSNGTFTPTSSMKIGFIVVGGGGGGGATTTSYSGGGSGGGIAFSTFSNGVTLTGGTTYTITVGAGGNGAAVSTNNAGSNGNDSTITGGGITITGGRGTGGPTALVGSDTAGGTGSSSGVTPTPTYLTGGSGGGTLRIGLAGRTIIDNSVGIIHLLSGGGGGGGNTAGGAICGGAGGGGAAAYGTSPYFGAAAGVANTGSGGGGGIWQNSSTAPGGNGGSGIVYIFFPNNNNSLCFNKPSTSETLIVVPNTTNARYQGWQNNNISWVASSSSYHVSSTNYPHYAFSNQAYGEGFPWIPNLATSAPYAGNATGNYTQNNFSTIIQTINSGVGVSGDWLQIQSSIPVVMKNYYFNCQGGGFTGAAGRMPKTYYICGSTDGSTWYPIQYVTYTSNPLSTPAPTTSLSTATYTIYNTPTGAAQTQGASTSVFYYTTSLNAYSYFRLVVTNVIGTAFSCTGDGNLALFWSPSFTSNVSDVTMALDNVVPNQLNVGGAMSVAGSMNVAGATNMAGGVTGPLIVPTGYVGIGTISPNYVLHVNGGANQANTSSICATDTNNDVMGLFSAGGYGNNLHIGAWNVQGSVSKNIVMQKLGGYLGIGNVTPGSRLHVHNTDSAFPIRMTNDTNGWLIGQPNNTSNSFHIVAVGSGSFVWLSPGSTSWSTGSDRRLKENIVQLSSVLENIMKLDPVKYNFIGNDTNNNFGLIAQDVLDIYPELVSTTSNENYKDGVYGIAYTEFVPILIKGMQEQQDMIQSQQAQIDALVARLAAAGIA
jgi:hypothetical protein